MQGRKYETAYNQEKALVLYLKIGQAEVHYGSNVNENV